MITLAGASRGRPHHMARVIDNALELASKDSNIEILIRLDEDDPALPQYLESRIGERIYRVGPRLGRGAARPINEMAMQASGDLVMQLSDDQEFITPDWNTLIENAAAPYEHIPTVFKLNEGRTKLENPVVNRAWLRHFGHLYPAEFSHLYSDTYVETIATKANRLIPIPGVTILHHKMQYQDATSSEARIDAKADFQKFIQFKDLMDAQASELAAL